MPAPALYIMMVCRFHSWKLDHFSVFVCGLRTELRLYDRSKVFFAHIFALSINGSCSYQRCSPLPRTASTAVNTPAAFPFSISSLDLFQTTPCTRLAGDRGERLRGQRTSKLRSAMHWCTRLAQWSMNCDITCITRMQKWWSQFVIEFLFVRWTCC